MPLIFDGSNQPLLSGFSAQQCHLAWHDSKDWSRNIFPQPIHMPCQNDNNCACEEPTSSSPSLAWCTKPTPHAFVIMPRGKQKNKKRVTNSLFSLFKIFCKRIFLFLLSRISAISRRSILPVQNQSFTPCWLYTVPHYSQNLTKYVGPKDNLYMTSEIKKKSVKDNDKLEVL